LNRVTENRSQISEDARRILLFARRAFRFEELCEHFEQEPEQLRPFCQDLLERGVLVPAGQADVFRRAFYTAPSPPLLGQRVLSPADLLTGVSVGDATWAALGAATDDGGGGFPGARFGPSEIRTYSTFGGPNQFFWDPETDRVHDRTLPLVDLGDAAPLPGEPREDVLGRLEVLAGLALDAGLRPLLLGGDHGCTLPVLRAVTRRVPRVAIVHFDAHADRNYLFGGLHNHANVFRWALDLPGVASLTQIGIRAPEGLNSIEPPVVDDRVTVVPASRALVGGRKALRKIPEDIPLYVSVDIDVVDPLYAPHTGTPCPGGVTVADLASLISAIARTRRVIGLDLMEVSFALGPNGTARSAAWLLWRFFLESSGANRARFLA
jgi:agmatinase